MEMEMVVVVVVAVPWKNFLLVAPQQLQPLMMSRLAALIRLARNS
jgi:hypothetical protein